MHHYVQPPWWRLLCPCTVGLGCDKKGDAFKYYRYSAFVHPLWSYGRPISSFSQEVLQTPKTFPKLAKLSQLHIMQCTLCLQCWLVISALPPLVYIPPPHSSSEIKQQRVLHPISQQHKTFSPSKPSLHPELLLSEVCELVRVALTLSCLALHRTSSIVHGCNVDLPILHFSWVENLGWLLLSCSCSC